MKPDAYWKILKTKENREAYSVEAGSTFNYISKHILREKGMTRMPRKEILVGLVTASKGNVSLDEAIDHFMVQPVKDFAEEQKNNKAA